MGSRQGRRDGAAMPGPYEVYAVHCLGIRQGLYVDDIECTLHDAYGLISFIHSEIHKDILPTFGRCLQNRLNSMLSI